MKHIAATLLFALITATAQSQIDLYYHWHDTTITPAGGDIRYNEVWGFEQAGREYAVLGSADGMHFIDITDSATAGLIDYVPGRAQGSGVIHRDFKNFGRYLYAVCDEGPSSLQIIDLSYLPDSVHVVYDSDSLIVRGHNLYIDTVKQNLYIFGPTTQNHPPYTTNSHPMLIFSLADPENPQYLARLDVPGVSYVHDGYVNNDTAFLNSANMGLYYGNFADPVNPVEIGRLDAYTDQGYNHSGWITEDRKFYVMADETHGMRLKIVTLEDDLNFLTSCNLIGSGVNQYSIPHNPLVKGHYVYVSYYYDGLQIFDIQDPCNPVLAGAYDTYPGDAVNGGFAGAWGTYPMPSTRKILISDMQTGLYVVTTSLSTVGNPPAPVADASFSLYPNPSSDLMTIGTAPGFTGNATIYDVSGKIVHSFTVTENETADIRALPSALYFLRLEDATGTVFSASFIKN